MKQKVQEDNGGLAWTTPPPIPPPTPEVLLFAPGFSNLYKDILYDGERVCSGEELERFLLDCAARLLPVDDGFCIRSNNK